MKGLQWTLLGILCCAGIVSSITREYFFAIKEIQWDYAPSGKNLIQNKTIKEDEWVQTYSPEFSMEKIALEHFSKHLIILNTF